MVPWSYCPMVPRSRHTKGQRQCTVGTPHLWDVTNSLLGSRAAQRTSPVGTTEHIPGIYPRTCLACKGRRGRAVQVTARDISSAYRPACRGRAVAIAALVRRRLAAVRCLFRARLFSPKGGSYVAPGFSPWKTAAPKPRAPAGVAGPPRGGSTNEDVRTCLACFAGSVR
jgi:hypothetical protein